MKLNVLPSVTVAIVPGVVTQLGNNVIILFIILNTVEATENE